MSPVAAAHHAAEKVRHVQQKKRHRFTMNGAARRTGWACGAALARLSAVGWYGTIEAFLEATIPIIFARVGYMVRIGLALLGDTRLHRVLLLLGPPRSGKTTLLALANATVGNEPFAFAGASLFDRAS